MTKQMKRQPTFTTDNEGTPIAVVPLANGRAATLDLTDWEDLICGGVTPNWTFNDNGGGFSYVRCQSPDNLLIVGREIMQAGKGEMVRYRNGDRTDLRRANLRLVRGGRAKGPLPEIGVD